MDKEYIKLGIRAIKNLEKRRDVLNNDVEIWIVRIKTLDKEIKEITEILNKELLNR